MDINVSLSVYLDSIQLVDQSDTHNYIQISSDTGTWIERHSGKQSGIETDTGKLILKKI